jgi:methyl-accepting chemotaxis protein
LIIVLVIAGVSAIVSVIIAFFIKNIITKPLIALSKFLNKAGSTGDITIDPNEEKFLESFMKNKDEIGQMIKHCGVFIDHVIKISEELESLATGDLTTDFEIISEVDTMGISVQRMVDSLNNMFHEINSSAEQVSSGSKLVADGAQALAQGSTEQTATVEELSSSISVIADKTKANAQMAEEAAKLAGTIIGSAKKGSSQMDDMMNAVKEINEASQSISKVMKTIDEIAFQTNILSLNAAVEAARAGQHGKGFAVVAEEVRNLAAKSAQSAKETGSMIQNAIDKAELGVKIATETAESLSEIVSGINESNKLSDQIAKSSDEQLEGISQINSGIDQVAQVVQQNSATAQESAAASQEMSGQSDMLQKLIMHFKLKDFKQTAQITTSEKDTQKTQPTIPTNNDYTFPENKNETFGKY